MTETTQMRFGAVGAFAFAALWVVANSLFLIEAGLPTTVPTTQEMAELYGAVNFRVASALWPIAYLSLVLPAIAFHGYLKRHSEALAGFGLGFLMLLIAVWFVYWSLLHSVAVKLALTGGEEAMSQLGLMLTAGNSLRLPLLWFIALFELFWGVALLKLPGIHRTAGWLLLAGSAATLLYFVLSMTGPILIAELFHHVLIVFLILGVFMIGLILRRAAIAQ